MVRGIWIAFCIFDAPKKLGWWFVVKPWPNVGWCTRVWRNTKTHHGINGNNGDAAGWAVWYPLVNCDIAIENGHLQRIDPLIMMIFHSPSHDVNVYQRVQLIENMEKSPILGSSSKSQEGLAGIFGVPERYVDSITFKTLGPSFFTPGYGPLT